MLRNDWGVLPSPEGSHGLLLWKSSGWRLHPPRGGLEAAGKARRVDARECAEHGVGSIGEDAELFRRAQVTRSSGNDNQRIGCGGVMELTVGERGCRCRSEEVGRKRTGGCA